MFQTSLEVIDSHRGIQLYRVHGEDSVLLTNKLRELASPHLPEVVFPGPMPVSVDTADFPKLTEQPYRVAEKTDGVRFVLMVAVVKGVGVAVLFDRKLCPYVFELDKCPKALYQGTEFDGELVRNTETGGLHYAIFDAVIVSGFPISRSNFVERTMAAATSLEFYAPTPSDTAVLGVKTFHATPDFPPDPRFVSDGYIFMPMVQGIVFGKHDRLFKLKTHHTVDFTTKGGKLWIFDEKTRRSRLAGVPVDPYPADGDIVECELARDAEKMAAMKWRVLVKRTDKTTSNSNFVLQKTLLNIRENLTYTDVVRRVTM